MFQRKQQVVVNGKVLTGHKVTSRISIGSVLRPILFVIFINDFKDELDSMIYLFAEDTKLFRIINNINDIALLQNDIDKLTSWTEKNWLLKSHPNKCEFMKLANSADDTEYNYTLLNTELNETKEEKDIGVNLNQKQNFDSHVTETVKKAHSMLGIIRRNFYHLNEKKLYPTLQVTCKMASRLRKLGMSLIYKVKHTEMMEGVQRRATKQIPGFNNLSYVERPKKTGDFHLGIQTYPGSDSGVQNLE